MTSPERPPTYRSSPPSHWHHSVLGPVGYSLLFLPLCVAKVLSSSLVYCAKIVEYIHVPGSHFLGFCIATVSCKALCDLLITVGMVYTLLSNRAEVRRTNSVVNLLTIYAIDCGTLNLVFAISSLTLLATSRNAFLYAPFFFIMIRLYFCAFVSMCAVFIRCPLAIFLIPDIP
ncbi:hypothetical protein EI94DRAFT_168527 [Lactarius quietus]|nr:hypothetical protein EI94DRAFT_168527 [Lactarius quietus]